ncbi:hypothetical protein ONZ45_g11972 [Pleurotus djamor]|nr:hypothetical protein ONZ45_g11972 [Pleurotus djamor]
MSDLFGLDAALKSSLETHDQSDSVIQAGPFSTVSRTYGAPFAGAEPQWLAVKAASINRSTAKEPHDIIKELRHLVSLSHPNIIRVLHHERSSHTLLFKMPYIPYSLTDLLASPLFSPHPSPFSTLALADSDSPALERHQTAFTLLAKSLIFQILSALAYLDSKRIAHRDIKPSNVLITPEGRVKLIDFGISFRRGEREKELASDLWPEYRDRLYFEVSTGPYRAPELLFGSRNYDLHAVDLWSLGATIAEFFTPIQLLDDDDEDLSCPFPTSTSQPSATSHQDDIDDPATPLQPFILPPSCSGMHLLGPRYRWARHSLFDASRGEIGLAWSIFRVRGTPNENVWPGFDDLPDAKRVDFMETPRVELRRFLPNLPTPTDGGFEIDSEDSDDDDGLDMDDSASPLGLIEALLVYPPTNRLTAAEALTHLWFTVSPPIMLPPTYAMSRSSPVLTCTEWEGNTLGYFLKRALGPSARSLLPPAMKP